jgi:protein-tyrosine phosphatase
MTFTILTVCIGNICRSPTAERLLVREFADQVAAGAVAVGSAGVNAMVGRGVQPRAATELERLGGSAEGFAARLLEREHMEAADLILTATTDVRAQALGVSPRAMRRTFTMVEFAELCRVLPDEPGEGVVEFVARAAGRRSLVAGLDLDIADPYGRSQETNAAVADQIDAAARVIAERLRALLPA